MSSIEKIIASKLKDMNKSISIAESCTGGSICSKIVHNQGASIIFKGGIICYSTESKMKLLEVDPKIISDFSVVSKQVCESMAISVKKLYNSDYSIATTGNVGPEKGDSDAEIGKVFISIASEVDVKTYELNFNGDRKTIINNAVLRAFELLNDILKN